MTLRNIRGKGFYTDGSTVFYNETRKADGRIVEFTPCVRNDSLCLNEGVSTAYSNISLDTEVRLVIAGEKFFNGEIEIVNAKELKAIDVMYSGEKYGNDDYIINYDKLKFYNVTRLYDFNNVNFPTVIK